MIDEALQTALGVAPGYRTLTQVARKTNEALELDWSEAKWRGIWKDHPGDKFLVQKKLGEALNRHVHGQKLHLQGDMRVAIVSDVHAPYHDREAIALASRVIKWWKPDVLIHNGDNVDFQGISKFDPNPARQYSAQDEVDLWQSQVAIPLNAAAGASCRKIVLPGNHDLRLLKLLWRHPELFSVRSLQLPTLFEVEKLGMEYVGYAVVFDDLLEVSHGTKANSQSGYTARSELSTRGYSISTATGHVHRAGRHEYARPYGGIVVGQEIPCLCGLRPDYMVDPNWVQGMGLVEIRNGQLWIQAVTFTQDYTCNVGGRRFEL